MPVQSLTEWTGGAVALPVHHGTYLARLFVFGMTGIITALGTYGMYQVISPVNVTWLQAIFAALFALTFTWISFACASAILGFFLLLPGWHLTPKLTDAGQMGRNALLMPIYNEDPARVFATLERMARNLQAAGAAAHFDMFILSDTRTAEAAAREEEEFASLRARAGGILPIYYRRRSQNHHRKAGNIADFVTRWGGAYDHMVVLDADSDMTAETLTTLARAMAADARAGIIQSLPHLRNQWTPYARMTQFAGRVYGPVVAAGLASWHGRDGNYWGHNAIIRVSAFAAAAGLPELKGRKPFGGHVLSHDFIEAALMRRAGWAVYMLPDLLGSYEETPPSLLDLAVRDRRWAQGNLQHLKIVGARGLHWVSRVHLIQGIMSYLASPLWLLLLLAGLTLAMVARYTEPDYFPNGFSLFPAWPVFDPVLAFRLLIITAIVLYLPKLLGVILAWQDPELRRGCGGTMGLVKSVLGETALSMVLSPIMMLIQTRFVIDVMLGRDSGWNAQNREGRAVPLTAFLKPHWLHVSAGLAFAGVAALISWQTFLWFLPIMAGLVGAPVISWWTARVATGKRLHARNVFRTPDEAGTETGAVPGTEVQAA